MTKNTIVNPVSRRNVMNTFEELFDLNVVPIVNENDTVATYEIEIGDNDTLSAIVAALIDADLLLLLSDIDGLFTDDPNSNPNAELIHVVEKLDDHLLKMGKSTSTSDVGTGGMASKLTAAKLASAAGTDMVIANGEDFRNIHRVIEGQDCGTLFLSHKKDEFYLMDYLEKML